MSHKSHCPQSLRRGWLDFHVRWDAHTFWASLLRLAHDYVGRNKHGGGRAEVPGQRALPRTSGRTREGRPQGRMDGEPAAPGWMRPEAGAGSRQGRRPGGCSLKDSVGRTGYRPWHRGPVSVTASVTCPSGGAHGAVVADSRAIQEGDRDMRKPGTRIPRASHKTVLPQTRVSSPARRGHQAHVRLPSSRLSGRRNVSPGQRPSTPRSQKTAIPVRAQGAAQVL